MKIYKFLLKSTVILVFITTFMDFLLLPRKEASARSIGDEKIEKVIYLTFDDGPSILTEKILDILKENDVKGTFFIIGNQIKGFESVIKRTHEEGHAIGLHTYTHKFKKIYTNRKSFIDEMLKTQEEIYSITGTKPTVIRFPGGSRKRLTRDFLDQLHSYSFTIYDWNAYMSDGLNCKASPDRLYREATKTTVSEYPIILLMHCDYMHINTCKALPKVIKYYNDNGFQFKLITGETPELYFPIGK